MGTRCSLTKLSSQPEHHQQRHPHHLRRGRALRPHPGAVRWQQRPPEALLLQPRPHHPVPLRPCRAHLREGARIHHELHRYGERGAGVRMWHTASPDCPGAGCGSRESHCAAPPHPGQLLQNPQPSCRSWVSHFWGVPVCLPSFRLETRYFWSLLALVWPRGKEIAGNRDAGSPHTPCQA